MAMPSWRAAWMTRVPSGTSIGRPSTVSLGKESPLFGRRDRGRLHEGRRLGDDLDGVHRAGLVAHVAGHALGQVNVMLHVGRDRDGVGRARLGAAGAPDAVLVDRVLDERGALLRRAAARDVRLVLVAEVL